MRRGDDVPGLVRREPGGVAFNVAFGLAQRGVPTRLIAAVGGDTDGDMLLNIARLRGIDTDDMLRVAGAETDQYTAVEGADGQLFGAVSDDSTLEDMAEHLFAQFNGKSIGGIVVLDGNLPQRVLDTLASTTALRGADLRLVPASPVKAHRIKGLMLARPATVYANIAEANAILSGVFDDTKAAAAAFVEQGAKAALVTDGARPAAYADSEQVVTAAPPPVIVGTVTGAGDALVAGHIAAQISGRSPWDALAAGLRAAADAISKQRQSR
ncbi:MAG: PfkB family carbohydrate kinase [Pseudomonadota bacterium]